MDSINNMFIQQFVIGTNYKVVNRIKNRIAVTCNIIEREDKTYLWGAERYAIKMCNALSNVYDVHLFQYSGNFLNLSNITIHPKTNNFFSKNKFNETAKRIQELSPQCILCNAGTGHQALYWLIISKMTNVPIIMFFHNEPQYIKDTLRIVHGREYICKQVENKGIDYIYELILSSCDKLAFLLSQYIDCKYEYKSSVFYNCIELPDKVDINNERNRLLYVGRINSTIKRTDLLLDYVKYTKYQCDILGYSYWEDGYIDMNGYSDFKNIHYYGYQKNVTDYYKKANILVIPSLYEGLPTVALEAMSYGVPIIGFEECRAMKELIIDGYNGWIVKKDLGSVIEKAMQFDDIIQMRKNCIKESKKYDINNIIKRIIDVIEELKCE
mgnify:CR=1 FL=1